MILLTAMLLASLIRVLLLAAVMRLHDLFAQLFLSLVDISVEFIPILSNRELLVVINGDVNFPVADWLIIWVVELSNVGVS